MNKFLTLGVLISIAFSGFSLYSVSGPGFGIASPSDVQSTNFTQLTTNALTVNTSNAGTSTTAVGCIQTYATSTAQPIRLEFSTSTPLASTNIGTVANGTVAWRYGTCPF